jgi:tetratricopeptide (TPR) repeat protein
VESDEVQSEWLAALDERKVIVPILYQKCRVPFRLKPIQYIDFTSRSSDDISALNDVLIALGKTESTLSRPAEISVPKEKLSVPSSIASNPEEATNPEDATFWYNEGNALSNQKKYDEAINAYDKAIRLDPNYIDAWYWKGIALYNQEKYDEAIKAYDEAIRLDPNYAAAWYWKGNAFEALGRTSEANAAFAKAEELGYTG